MLKKVGPFIFVLSLVFLATPSIASAQSGAASGKFKFFMEDELLKAFEFDARTDERTTTGFMDFTDEAKIEFQDVDGTGEPPKDEPVPFSMKAEFDAMTIEKNRAIINGVIRDSSYRSYIGKWVQLVIEDNDGVEVPDKFVWSFCTPEPGGWIPQDAEVPGDRGAFLSWWATDAERKDDVGIPSPNIIPGTLKSCKVHPIQTYEFATILKGEGVISIKQ
ncbi:MAG TPA: hypothetical protein VFT44_12700 [Pyrinomonadaceae bacterium]|nr:hypothetical protein [Pyrinomonadaceae bacterium]